MRFELLLFLCLACLAFTAQAAPASARNALLEQKLQRRSGQDKQYKSNHEKERQHHKKHHRHESKHPGHASGSKHTRNVPLSGIRAGEEAASHLLPQEHLVNELRAKIEGKEKAAREKAKARKLIIQVEDTIHIAKTGSPPTKFPTITVSSFHPNIWL